MRVFLAFSCLVFVFQIGLADTNSKDKPIIKITSSAFKTGEAIPKKYTCDDSDVSPPLEIRSVPSGTRSLVLIMEDPDAPRGIFVHWILFNLPGTNQTLAEKVPSLAKLDNGPIHGQNGFTQSPSNPLLGYNGPCPPEGTHRYFFRVYALNTVLNLQPGATKNQILVAMKDHLIGEGFLMGRYTRAEKEKK